MKKIIEYTSKKACIKFAEGCPRNMLNAEVLIEYIKKNDWKLVENINEAQMILIGVCGFDDQSERISKVTLKFIMGQKKRRALCLPFGCLTEIKPSIFEGKSDLLPLGYKNLETIDEIFKPHHKLTTIPTKNTLDYYHYYTNFNLKKSQKVKLRAAMLFKNFIHYIMRYTIGIGPVSLRPIGNKDFNIIISSGCTGTCTYCVIKNVSGKYFSISTKDIINQFNIGLNKGYKVFRFLGEDVGAYGLDRKTSITELLKKILEKKGEYYLILEDFNPKWLIKYKDDLLPLLESNSHHIHHIVIPLQSGSEKILKSMKRQYTAEAVLKTIQKINNFDPKIKLSTHVIVGFPGETEDDFQATINALKKINFCNVEAHKYSKRYYKRHSMLQNEVSEVMKLRRLFTLRKEFINSCRIRI